jgi:tetratricopeptide (TPR) repeat protein
VTSYKGVTQRDVDRAPIISHDDHTAPSVFTPENLLREARRQKGITPGLVPNICVLDPDGDLVDYLQAQGLAQPDATWACYHTELYTFRHEGLDYGIVGRVVGAPFAVLVAEELFASGCRLIISITSAGQITPIGAPPYFVLIERALRDEGTSYHYLPPAPYSELRRELGEVIRAGWDHTRVPLYAGASWTTDAPLSVIAEHWQLGRDVARARNALVQLAEKSCAVHAYRDAALAARRALELWPEGEEDTQRLDLLDRLGLCAQLNGEIAEAARAWREVAEHRRQAEDWPRFADTQRRLASVYELQGNWEQALEARRAAADAFIQSHLLGEAAAERLAVAVHLSGACHYDAAIEAATHVVADAERAGRLDLQISALAVKGQSLAKSGQYEAGREMVHTGCRWRWSTT